MMFKVICTAVAILLLSAPFFLQAQCNQPNAQFEFPIGDTRFCEGAIVKIDNRCDVENEVSCIEKMTIRWGDGAEETFTDFLDKTHRYDIPDSVACTLTSPEKYEIKLTVFYKNGLDNSITKEVTIYPKPVALFSIQNPICINEPEACVNNNSCWDSLWTWTFQELPSGSFINYSNEEPCHIFDQLGQYQVTLVASNVCPVDGSLQLDTISQIVQVIDTIQALATTSDLIACDSLTVTLEDITELSATVILQSRLWTISPNSGWVFINNTTNTSEVAEIFFFEPGDYTIELEVESQCNVDKKIIGQVHLVGKPSALVEGVEGGCLPHSFSPNATNIDDGNSNNLTIDWIFPNGIPSTATGANPGNIQYNNSGTDTVKMILSNECHSINYTFIINVSDLAMTDVAVNLPVDTCAPFLVALQNNSQGGNSCWTVFPNIPGAWEFVNGTDAKSENPEIRFLEAGTFSIKLSLLNVGCGSDSTWESSVFSIYSTPVAAIADVPMIQCIPANINPYDPATSLGGDNNATVEWLFPGGSPATSSVLDPGTINYPDTGDYEISLIVGNRCNSDTTIVYFHLDELQEIEFSNPDTVCSNDASFPIMAMPIAGVCNFHPAIVDCIFYPKLAFDGWNYITYEWGEGNCLTRKKDSIYVIPVTVSAGDDLDICADVSTIVLTDYSPGSGVWTGPGVVDDSGIVDISLLSPGQTVYLVYTVQTSSFGCAAFDTLALTVQPLPIADFTIDGSLCVDSTLTFLNTSIDNGQQLTCKWDFGDGTVDNDCNPTHQFSNLDDYTSTLLVVSPFGCEDTISQALHVSKAPSLVDFTLGPREGCADLSVQISNTSIWDNSATIAFQWDFGNGTTSTDLSPEIITYTSGRSDTIYIIHLEVASGCGGSGAVDTVKVFPQPVAEFGPHQNSYCSGDSVLFGNSSYGNPDSCFWDYGNGNRSTNCYFTTLNLQTYFTDTSQSVFPVQLIVKNGCGEDTLTKEVIINPTDVRAFFNVNPRKICLGDTVFLESFASDGTRLYYKFGDGNESDEENPRHVYTIADTFTIIQYVEGCGFDSMTNKVIVLPIPEVRFDAPDTICLGEVVVFSDLSSVNVVDRKWMFGDGNTSDETNPSHIFDAGGEFTVELSGRSNNGCVASFSKLIYVREILVPLFSLPDSLCSGESVSFLASSNAGGSCSWDFGDGNTQAGCAVNHAFDSAGVYRVRLFVSDEFGCSNEQERNIFVRDTPIPDFDFILDQLCSPAISQFENLSNLANGYTWFLGDDSISTLLHPLHLYEYGDTFEVRLVASNDAICFSEISKSLIVHPTPTAIINPSDTSVCGSETIYFFNQSIGAIYTYYWDFGDSIVSFDPATNHSYSTPGIYDIRLRVNTEFCEDDTVGRVSVFVPVSSTFTKSDLLCFGDSDGSAAITILTGTAPYEFDWSNGSKSSQANNLSAGNYLYLITDSVGCQDSATINILQPPAIDYEILDNAVVSCFGGDDGFIRIAAKGGTPAYEYVFLTLDPNSSILSEDSVLLNVPAGNYILKITDQNACEQPDTFTIYQNDLITPEVTLKQITCFGADDGQVNIVSLTGGLTPYKSILLTTSNDSLEGGRITPVFPNLQAAIYTLNITDSLNCMEQFEFEIIEPDSIYITIEEENQIIRLGDSLLLATNYLADDPVFSWTPTNGLSDPESDAPFALPFETMIYQILMRDRHGCIARDTIRLGVDIFREVYIPNGFTPNADGLNDVFRIRTTAPSVSSVAVFRIYDRWGAKLFEATNYDPKNPDENASWDGRFRGQDLPPGQYVYYAEINYIDGEKELFEGDITLIR